jgi:hypothetical protein
MEMDIFCVGTSLACLYSTLWGLAGVIVVYRRVLVDKANLPWNNKARYASMYGRNSNAFLRSQYPNDKPAYLYRRTKRGQEYKLGLCSVSQNLIVVGLLFGVGMVCSSLLLF